MYEHFCGTDYLSVTRKLREFSKFKNLAGHSSAANWLIGRGCMTIFICSCSALSLVNICRKNWGWFLLAHVSERILYLCKTNQSLSYTRSLFNIHANSFIYASIPNSYDNCEPGFTNYSACP